jgi:subtilisin-like proprotein convertase family protein
LTAWLSLGAAGGLTDGVDPPIRPSASSTLAEASHSAGTPRMLAQVSEGAPGAAGGPPSTAQARRKLRVADVDLARLVTDAGGQLVADYGSFQVVDVDEATATSLAAAHEAVEILHDHDVIMLNVGPLDTTSPQAAALRAPAGTFSGKRLHLVQFSAPVQEPWLDSVKKTGVQLITYIPFNAYLVYGDAPSIAQLQSTAQRSPVIQWDGAYLEDYKVHPRAREVTEKGEKREIATDYFAVQMVDDPAANAASLALIDLLKLAPILSQNRSLGYLNVIVRLPPSRLVDVARQPEVISIQPYVVPRLFDERQNQIVAGNISGIGPSGPGYLAWLASKGFTQQQFTASGFVVDVSDDGLDDATTSPNHFGLYEAGNVAGQSRVVYARREPPAGGGEIRGCFGHGTLNTHIVAGYNNLSGFPHADAAGFRYGLGVAPFVKVGSSVIFTPGYTSPDFEDLQSRAYANGARISTNSWGADVGDGTYNSDSQRYDALVRDAQPTGSAIPVAGNQQMVIVFAAGNDGSAPNTVGSPGTGKNVLTVGASENVHSHATAVGGNDAAGNDGCSIPDTGANSLNDIIAFSSRGPTADGRVRPDVVAPGTHITGGVFQAAAPGVNGTADSCFNASGVCALPGGGAVGDPDNFFPLNQQFYTTSSGTSHSTPAVAGGAALVRQWFINQGMSPASPAMTKGFLMNSARYLTGTGANDTLPSHSQGMGLMDLGRAFDGTPRILRDEVDLFTATGQSFTWTGTVSDASKPFRVTLAWTDAPGNTAGNAFNNDLDLTVVAGGTVYKGNVFSGPSSIAGGSADARNNVESVFLPAGVTGPFAVIVTAANINSNGVPNNASALDQDFALIVYNAVAANVPVLAAQSMTIVGGDAAVEPSECNDLNVTLKNWGTAPATGVSAALATSTPGVTLPSAGSPYPDIAAGGTATNTTLFRVSTASTFTCGTTVALTVTATTNQGVQVLSQGLVSGAAAAMDFVSTDVPKAIPDLSTVESAVTVSGIAGPIDKVTVSFYLTHTFDADLDIFLVGPDGTTVELTSDNGGGANNYGTSCGARTVFDDTAAASITAGVAPFVGTFRPEQALSAFAGKSGAAVNGTWRLRITDDEGVDVGTLQCWTLTITRSECTPGTGPCPSSQNPNAPGGLGQFKSAGVTVIPVGGTTDERTVVFKGTVNDPDGGTVKLQVELRPVGTAFTNKATHESTLVSSGSQASVTASGLTNGTSYHWQARAMNSQGATSAWTPFGGNAESVADVSVSVVSFADVPSSHPFWLWIEALFQAGITGGCGTTPLIFCPDATVSRAQMAVFLLRGIHGAAYLPPAASGIFADVPLSHSLVAWIERLFAEGITGGCGTNPPTYCPEQSVTRDQMAVFLLRAKHGSGYQPPPATGIFVDVPLGHPFAAWIEQLFNEGITGGCGTNPARYCPSDTVTRGQMAVFLVRAFGLPL